jgi:hypothetical protein
MTEITVKPTERQAHLIAVELERVIYSSTDVGYRRQAENILLRLEKAADKRPKEVTDVTPSLVASVTTPPATAGI